MSEIRFYLAVVNYLNHPVVHNAFIAALNRINDIMNQFDDAVARNNLNNNVRTGAGTMWREFVYVVIIERTQSTQSLYCQALWRIQGNWENELASAAVNTASPVHRANIRRVILSVNAILRRYDPMTNPNEYIIDTTGLFADPRS